MGGWQLSDDTPTAYARFATFILAPWTVRACELTLAAACRNMQAILRYDNTTSGLDSRRISWPSSIARKCTDTQMAKINALASPLRVHRLHADASS